MRVDLGTLPCDLDGGIATRAAIGLVVLASDQTIEHEFRHLLPDEGIGLYCARIAHGEGVTPEMLRAMRPDIARSAALILPGIPLDVLAFGCSSAAMAIGEEGIFAELRKDRPGIACTTPVTAALAALAALGARRIGVLTPYEPGVNAIVLDYLAARGLEIAAFGSFNKIDDRDAARISPASIEAGIAALSAAADLEAVFVSCTSLRLSGQVPALEARFGVPVISSDYAIAWHCLRLAGVTDPRPDLGRLFAL